MTAVGGNQGDKGTSNSSEKTAASVEGRPEKSEGLGYRGKHSGRSDASPLARELRREVPPPSSRSSDAAALEGRLRRDGSKSSEVSLIEGRELKWDHETREALVHGADKMVTDKYGEFIRPEKLSHRLENRMQFQDDQAFRARYMTELKKLDPALTREQLEASVEGVHGYTQGEKIFLNSDSPIRFGGLVHEKIHQVSSDRLRADLGVGLDEGLTERFARQCFKEPHSPELFFDKETHRLTRIGDRTPKYYGEERAIAQRLSSIVGDYTLARAKFGGDLDSLRTSMDQEIGLGAYDRFRSKLAVADTLAREIETDRQPDQHKLEQLTHTYKSIEKELTPGWAN